MRFESETIDLPELSDGTPTFGMAPIQDSPEPKWLILKGSGELLLVDLADRSVTAIAKLPESCFNPATRKELRVSGDGRFAAVADSQGINGVVMDLASGKTTLHLSRQDYHVEHCSFPLTFVRRSGRWLLIHGTEWNRLDVSDPLTGELLTARESPRYKQGERALHYFDYFHASLLPSPDYSWIADNGWVWQPTGIVRTWSVERWLSENIWESEDGPTAHCLTSHEDWNQPICWVDNRTLAAWDDTTYQDDAGRLELGFFDVETGAKRKAFKVPKGRMFAIDGCLVISQWNGVSVWDVESGSELLQDKNVAIHSYHPGAKVFRGSAGSLSIISRLIRDQ